VSERATRPLNQDAVQAADDDLYSKHEGDPRPNALYDADGNRLPLSASDPNQAGLREEWMDDYKANGGATEPMDTSGGQPDQVVHECDQQAIVNPLIFVEMSVYDDSDEPAPDEEDTGDQEGEQDSEASDRDDSQSGNEEDTGDEEGEQESATNAGDQPR
jgi:hypothetical protein